MVLLPETFKRLDCSKRTQIVTHQVCPCDQSLLPSTVLSAYICVLSITHVPIHALKCSRKAWECCPLLNLYRLRRTAVLFSWCSCALWKKPRVDASGRCHRRKSAVDITIVPLGDDKKHTGQYSCCISYATI